MDPPLLVQAIILFIGFSLAAMVVLIPLGALMHRTSPPKGTAATNKTRQEGGNAQQPVAYSLDWNPVYRLNPNTLIAEGKATYDVLCSSCHQPGGEGKVGLAPNIRNQDFLTLASDEFLFHTIMAGRPGTAMTSWAHLDRAKIDGLIAYLRSGQSSKPTQISVDRLKKHHGNGDLGSKSYQTYCASCHGTRGTGYAEGGSGPGIGLPGFLAHASDDYIFQTVKHGRTGSPMRSFMGAKGLANLSPEEVNNIIAYLRSGAISKIIEPVVARAPDPEKGKMHFTANCMACHQEGGTGKAGFAPSIRNRDFLAIASDDFIIDTIRKGRPGTSMVQRPDLKDDVLKDIIAYLRSLDVANAVVVELDLAKNHADSGKADAGQKKYAVYCASCHGEKGAGYVAGGSGPGIGLAGFLGAASDDYIFQTLKIGRIGTAMRPFIGAKGLANLSEQDAFDIIAYLRSLQFNAASNYHLPQQN